MKTSSRLAPRVVAILGLVLTTLVTSWLAAGAQAERDVAVLRTAETLRTAITSEINGLEVALETIRQGLRLDDGAEDPTGRDWTLDLTALDSAVRAGFEQGTLSTARAVGLVRVVAAEDLDRYTAAVAARDAVPGFAVHPAPQGTAYTLERLWPLTTNEGALGFDLGSEAHRRTALELARDSGSGTATAPIVLRQDASRTSILLMVPAYDDGSVPLTKPVRRSRFVGAVSAAVEPQQLLDRATLLDLKLDVSLADIGPITVLATAGREQTALLTHADVDPQTATPLDLHVGNRRWRLLVQPGPDFPGVNWWPAIALALAGLALTALCATLTHEMLTREARAEALVEDATADLHVAQRQLQKANARLREADALKTSFLVTVSHELRTPLTTIRGFANLLGRSDGVLSDEDRRSFLSQMVRSADGLSALLQEVLEFAEMEQFGPSTLQLRFDLNRVVQAAVDELRLSQSVALQQVPDLVALGDPQSLQRALVNVLSNAAAYGPETSTIGVMARPGPDDSTIEVVVDDQGPGIAAEERDRVFERFYRGAEAAAGTIPGTGIGLTVARQLLTSVGGDVHVTDSPGGGARVVLTVPRAQGIPQAADESLSTTS